jgi:preprotein translocase subunit SecY
MLQSISFFNLFCLIVITPFKLLLNSCTILVSILDNLILLSIVGLLVGLITIYMSSGSSNIPVTESTVDPTRKLPPIRVPNPSYVPPRSITSRPKTPTAYLPSQGASDAPRPRVPNPNYQPGSGIVSPGYIPPKKVPGTAVEPLTDTTGPVNYIKPKF